MKKNLSSTNVLSLPTKRSAYHCWDHGSESAKGLGVLVSPNGVRTYRAVFYYPGSTKPHALKLGRVGEMSLDEAREKTREVRGLARKGIDPKKADPVRSSDFKTAVETWTREVQIGKKQNRSALKTQSHILSSCRAWWQRPVATIMKHEIVDLLYTKREVAPYAANTLYSHLKVFFKWASWTDRIQMNPIADMPRPWDGAKARERDWFKKQAADKVIRDLWKVASELGGDDEKFIKLEVILGKRKNAVLKMAWEQIANDWFWRPVPGSRTKRNHPVPLPELARKVLGRRQKTGRVLHVRERKLLMVVREKIELPDFFWHGIRHIHETKMGELKVPKEHRDLLYDHASVRGSGKVYDHNDPTDYIEEMSAAQKVWCGHILKVVGRARR